MITERLSMKFIEDTRYAPKDLIMQCIQYVHTYIRAYAYMHTCIHTPCIRACVHTFVGTYICILCIYTKHAYAQAYIHTWVGAYT